VDDNTRVIVIGASAGGVQALLRIAPRLASDFAAPIVLVLHSGAHRNFMPELLNAGGSNRAVFAHTGAVPQPGTIYVAPPDQHVLLEGGVLRLSRGPKEHHARPAIDPLFRSAALDCGPRAVGVVLTGMLDDGAAGLRAIKACGGTTVVQDPEDAAEPSMPRSALASVKVDYVLGLDGMADLLNKLAQPLKNATSSGTPEWLRIEHAISLGRAGFQDLRTIGSPSGFTCPDCGGALFELKPDPVRFLCHTGHGFSLRSLASTQELVTDKALWAGLRALQEKEAVLRRLAEVQIAATPGAAEAMLAAADKLAEFIVEMRAVVHTAPTATSAADSEGLSATPAGEPQT
jgi:two-component system, chemotaxis family, protein-glutamate methylesterase/glutaminase